MHLSRIIYLMIAIIGHSLCQAQDTSNTISKVSISSPNAASLGKYGDIPVGYHTGTPEISVPIYNIKTKSLQLPVSLSYHASGIKVQETSSWVGAGWTLNAGGAITRTINGAPDDRGISTGNVCTHGYYADYGYHNYLWRYAPGELGAAPDGYVADELKFMSGIKDGEPDLYFFNFAGYTGKFYFNDDRTPVLLPGADFRIQPDFVSGTGFQGFIITTPDGKKYYFGKTGNNGPTDPIEISVPGTFYYNYASANAAVSSWFLNKIISHDGLDSVTFEYDQERYSYHTLSMFPISDWFKMYLSGVSNVEYNLVKNFVSGVRLKNIKFGNGSILFTPVSSARLDLSNGFHDGGSLYDGTNTESKALGSITIKNVNGTYCKKDTFYFSYWQDNVSSLNGTLSTTYSFANLQSDKYRLRLDSVQELSCDNSITIPPYRFAYFTEFVPRRLSFGIDHWGFYNGVNSNETLIPTLTIKRNPTIEKIIGANRDAAWPAMRGGALQKITYPTGGNTTFEFEPHDTYCEYDSLDYVNRVSRSQGYDGSIKHDSVYYTFSGNVYHVSLSNTTTGGSAEVSVSRTSDNATVYTQSVNPGQSKEEDIVLPQGNYLIILFKNSPSTGHGCSVSFSELVPFSITRNVIVGGLRIKAITNNDNQTSQTLVTNYSYRVSQNPNGHSTGILYSRPTYIQVIRNDVYGFVWGPVIACNGNGGSPGGCATCDGTLGHGYYKSPSSLRPMATSQGNHIGYNEVFVSQTNNGYSVYRYYGSSYWDNIIDDVCTRYLEQSSTCNTNIPNYPTRPLPFEPMRGELKYEGFYNNSGQIIKDVWHYPQYAENLLTTPGFISANMDYIQSHTTYELNSSYKIKDSTETTTYVPGTGTSVTEVNASYFNSKFHHQPIKHMRLTSEDDTLVKVIQYAFDFQTPSCLITNDSTSYYLGLIHSDSVSMISAVNTCTPQSIGIGYNNCRFWKYHEYRRLISLDRIQLINYRRRKFSDSAISACHISMMSSADNMLKPIIQLQQEFRNHQIEFSDFKNGKLLKSSFNIYDYSTNPSTMLYPSVNQGILLITPVTDFVKANANNTSVLKDSRYQNQTSARYNLGNLTNVKPRDGINVSYIWDYENSLPIAVVNGAIDSMVAYTSFEADGNGNWSVSSALREPTMAITGRKSYQLSNGNISKTGLSTSTEYLVSYWTKNSTSFAISGSQSIIQGKTINGWTCFLHKITGVSQVTLSGTGVIDELRLYPKDAQMMTYTYDPLTGITNQIDANNTIISYEYDAIGRLKIQRDQLGRILKTYEYKFDIQQ